MFSRHFPGFLLVSLLTFAGGLHAENPPVSLWPEGRMPGTAATEPEAPVPRDDGFTRITNISRPTLEVFPASRTDGRPAPAVIICPGGGYRYVVVDKEGSAVAAWLNASGITAFVLKYRTPDNRAGALQDVQRAIRLVRSRAAGFGIDPAKTGVMGFSAGGHVAARASNTFGKDSYAPIDEIDQESARPDFAILVYPAYLDDKQGNLSPDLDLTAAIPPTLIVHTEDDKGFISGSKRYAESLAGAKKDHQFLLYATGGHGYGMKSEGAASRWPGDALDWLRSHAIGDAPGEPE